MKASWSSLSAVLLTSQLVIVLTSTTPAFFLVRDIDNAACCIFVNNETPERHYTDRNTTDGFIAMGYGVPNVFLGLSLRPAAAEIKDSFSKSNLILR